VDDFAAATTVFVEPPQMGRPLAPGEIALNFGISGIAIGNEQAWEDVIDAFVASDPDVGDVTLDTPDFSENNLGSMAQNYDCFYFPNNQVPSADLSLLLSLDPFMDADFDFDRGDVLGDILAQVQRDNRTWAYPLNIEPQVLWYNPQVFMQSGVLEPVEGWTIDAFEDALRQLQTDADVAAFTNNSFSNEYILMLIAAYGGMPIDFRTNSPTLQFTDPAAVAAIERVLDLAKEGYIDYEALFNPNNRARFFSIDSDTEEPIYSDSLSGLLAGINVRGFGGENGPGNFGQAAETTEATHVPATYPQGSQYIPVSYSIGTGYISATAQNPEACYRWLSTIAGHQELFTRMPARQSLIEDPNLTSTLGETTVNFYRAFSQILSQPNVVEFPTTTTGVAVSENVFYMNWLFRAFDRYVLENADLERELEEAQFYAEAFRGCADQLEPPEPGTVAQFNYFQSLNECAATADPSLSG
jgi:ABC-type glycerol-3-phosphate transport system substrate-binding protein